MTTETTDVTPHGLAEAAIEEARGRLKMLVPHKVAPPDVVLSMAALVLREWQERGTGPTNTRGT